MRDSLPEVLDECEFPAAKPFDLRFQAASNHAPPQPVEMLARLGLLIGLALGFGLVAQAVVGGAL